MTRNLWHWVRALPMRVLCWLYSAAIPVDIRRPFYALPLIAMLLVSTRVGLATMSESTKERADPYLILGVGLVYTVCMVACVLYTHSWAIRSAGVLLTLAGDGLLYTTAGATSFWAIDPATKLSLVNWARAGFYDGGPLLLIGLVIYVVTRSRHNGEPL